MAGRAKRRLEQRRAEEARPIPASRPSGCANPSRDWKEELEIECCANAAYEAYRTRGLMRNGGAGAHSPPKPYTPPATPSGKVNTTDPDSRNVKTLRGWLQGYNAQAATTERQIVIAIPWWMGTWSRRSPRWRRSSSSRRHRVAERVLGW